MGRSHRHWRLWRSYGGRARIGWNDGDRARLSNFPDGGIAAALAIAQDAIVDGNNVGFDAVLVNAFKRLADIADQGKYAEFLFFRRGRRKLHLPEIFHVIKERNALGVGAGVLANLADDADFRFFVAFGPAKNHLLFD